MQNESAPPPFTTPPSHPAPCRFVFGQPILQLLYTVFDFSAFEGRGGLHFALAKKATPPPVKPSIVVPVAASSSTGMPVRCVGWVVTCDP
jgi:hypothetical protein